MPSIIEREIDSVKRDIPSIKDLKSEYIFSLVCYKYFFNNGELSYRDYTNIFVDGKSDGGIDLALVIEDSNDEPSLVLIQSKDIDSLANTDDVIAMLVKMDQTHRNFLDNRTAEYSRRLKQKLRDKLADIEDSNGIVNLVVFLNAELSDDRKTTIDQKIENNILFEPYNILIYDKNDIERQIENILEPKRFVDEGKVKFDKSQGKIEYGKNGILVSIFASSLKDVYDRFRDRGLFEQNFRYFIKNKKIDENIKKSLQERRNIFWFLNNGIIIGCNDFRVDGDNVKLYKFSIINGCQTTTLIGDYKGRNQGEDFVIPCKIIKPEERSNEDQFQRFISMIAESSNSQKPISDRDLKANSPEQRRLQSILKEHDPKIYLQIKRGEDKKRGLEAWQNITNDLFGQLVLSFNFQQPGTARSFKKKIFADEQIYGKVFRRNIDKINIIELLKLDYYYQQYLKKLENNPLNDFNLENVAINGRFTIIATIGFLIKLYRECVNISIQRSSEEWPIEIQKDNCKQGEFFKLDLPDNFEEILHALFFELISEIADIFSSNEQNYKTVTNFFKLDKYYQIDILSHLINRYVNNPVKKNEIKGYVTKIFKI
jgi:hypothetical protein